MKKMHICFYALFQFTTALSQPRTTAEPTSEPISVTTAETTAETFSSEFTTAPASEVTESNDCTRDGSGFCECNDDEYRKGFPTFDYLHIDINCTETFVKDKFTSPSY